VADYVSGKIMRRRSFHKKRRPSQLSPPALPGESEKETVLRELQEETGIVDAQFIEGFKEKIEYFYRRQGATIHKQVIFFLMETHTEKVQISFEHVGYTWLNYEQAMEQLTFKNAKDVLQKAQEFLSAQGKI
jgi:bis(5'-nucleosidyl)-tetraphosphatase